MTDTARVRFERALRAEPLLPPVAGLTFSDPDVLATVVPGCHGPADCLIEAARSMALDFVFVRTTDPWAAEVCERRGDLAVVWVVDGPLWPVLRSGSTIADVLRTTFRDPASLAGPLDDATECSRLDAARGLSLGADALLVADDLGGSERLLVTPEFARSEILPRLARIAEAASGRPVLFHSDGDVGALVPSLHDAGFTGLHSGGLSREDFESLFWEARRYGLVMLGGIPAAALGRSSVAAIQTGTRVALLAQAGGLLVADDGGISTAAEMTAYASALGAARGFVPTR